MNMLSPQIDEKMCPRRQDCPTIAPNASQHPGAAIEYDRGKEVDTKVDTHQLPFQFSP